MKKDLEKDIERLKLDWVNPNVVSLLNPNFVSVRVMDTSYEKGLELLRRQNLRPATLHELLCWTEWDGKEQVLALGTVLALKEGSYIPCLCEVSLSEPDRTYYTERRLAMLNITNDWKGDMIILGITKES